MPKDHKKVVAAHARAAQYLCELEGSELEENLRELQVEVIALDTPVDTLFDGISKLKTGAVWKKAEQIRSLGYNRLFGCTQQQRDKAAQQKKMKTLTNSQIAFMRQWCATKDDTVPDIGPSVDETHSNTAVVAQPLQACDTVIAFTGYLSDKPKDVVDSSSDNNDNDDDDDDDEGLGGDGYDISNQLPIVQPLKCHKLNRIHTERCGDERCMTLEAIGKLLKSKKTNHLALIVKRGYSSIDASKRAAETHGFASVSKWELPQSLAGHHVKVYSLLEDSAFSKDKPIPSEAEKYIYALVDDEMPCGLKKYLELELFPRIHLKVGYMRCGLHHSDVICSTVGHIVDADESSEYGKNHRGYWNGEMFVKQLSDKIILTFEHIYGLGYQALFLINNPQGHSAYAKDALLVSRMNINPGGKQAHMRPGWFMHNGMRIEQNMIFSPNHPQFLNEPKDNCDSTFKTLKKNMPLAMQSV
ncbi:uncharacterized protein F5147DRAFT_745701 [Suillus discolor]|uniref:Uncharacterized protein n=1 Tax=Suillus discolor TaxID=1912936 RepID=A0A9P7JUC2_9AGAM|nr:uncharacterized protein F5147DRAFT_745701 [Suillus discolor]KAG2108725.1 hypothetical protein F5147DRAFT_745701 [Suillus discolor]